MDFNITEKKNQELVFPHGQVLIKRSDNIILDYYEKWKEGMLQLCKEASNTFDTKIIKEIAKIITEYKQKVYSIYGTISGTDRLESSILEEFVFHIMNAIINKYSDDKNTFLIGGNIECVYGMALYNNNEFHFRTKKIDVCIYRQKQVGKETLNIVDLGVEAKRYIDKTMLSTITSVSDELRLFKPSSSYLAVCEDTCVGENELSVQPIFVDGNYFILRDEHRTDCFSLRKPFSAIKVEQLFAKIYSCIEKVK